MATISDFFRMLLGRPRKEPKKERAKPNVAGKDPRMFLGGEAPGLWASNHLKESLQVKGWQFVAIRCLAKMVSQADVQIHNVGPLNKQLKKMQSLERKAERIGDSVDARYWKREQARLARSAKKYRRRLRNQGLLRYGDPIAKSEPSPGGFKPLRHPVPWDDPLAQLLRRPNPYWSGVTLLFAFAQQLAITGTCYLWKVSNGLKKPREIYVLPTGLLTPRLPSTQYPNGSYYLSPLSSWGWGKHEQVGEWATGALGQAYLTGATIPAEDIKPVRWPNPLYLGDGLSPLDAAAVWVDVANEIDSASWYYLQNSARPGLIIERDKDVDPDPEDVSQFREDLRADNSGTPNTGSHLVLPKGLKAHDRSKNPAELDFQSSRIQYRDAGLAIHGVSPIATGIAEAGSYGAFWAAIKQTTEIAVQPMLDLLGGELTEFLGLSFDGPPREVTPQARSIDDPQLLEQRLRTDIAAGNVLKVNEYRSIRGLSPLPGEEGEAFAGQKQAGQIGAEGQGGGKDQQDADEPSEDHGANGSGGRDTGVKNPGKDKAPGRPSAAGGGSSGKGNRGNGPGVFHRNGFHD